MRARPRVQLQPHGAAGLPLLGGWHLRSRNAEGVMQICFRCCTGLAHLSPLVHLITISHIRVSSMFKAAVKGSFPQPRIGFSLTTMPLRQVLTGASCSVMRSAGMQLALCNACCPAAAHLQHQLLHDGGGTWSLGARRCFAWPQGVALLTLRRNLGATVGRRHIVAAHVVLLFGTASSVLATCCRGLCCPRPRRGCAHGGRPRPLFTCCGQSALSVL